MVVFLRRILLFCSCNTLKIFRNAVCVHDLILFLVDLLRETLHRLSKRQQ